MKIIWRYTVKVLVRVIRRFLGNQPANAYESITFNALRAAATQFGTGRAVKA